MKRIILTHNRAWTIRELVFFFIIFLGVTFIGYMLLKNKKIKVSQFIAGESLFLFLVVVLASTVFTRTSNGVHTYELIPLWSWYEIIAGNTALLEEIVLNMILLLPAGMLLPFVFDKKIKWYKAFVVGFIFSAFAGNTALLEEIVLNMILLLPAGMLLPFVFDKKIKWYKAFVVGFIFSAFIEVCQLVLCRGLFEWDDMIHNALGAMAGCIMSNKAFEKFCNKNNGRNI